jgi:hypothetical protein
LPPAIEVDETEAVFSKAAYCSFVIFISLIKYLSFSALIPFGSNESALKR